MGLYKKMHQVMVETEAITKSVTVGDNKNAYKAVGEADVLNVIKPLFKKHGLIIIQNEVSALDRFDLFPTKYGESARLMTQVHTKFKIVDVETGEFDFIEAIGNGVDTQDKASGKAQAYALKVGLQKTFLLFSGEDTDNEYSETITKTNAETIKSKKKQIENNLDAREKTLAEISDKLEALGDSGMATKILNAYKKKSWEEFKDNELISVSNGLDKKLEVQNGTR
jgi:hypothetical protein